jgi:hypothetical protein
VGDDQRTALEYDLESSDEARVISALHRACPCSGSPDLYEAFIPLLHRFKKDTRPAVRAVALHLEVDALERLCRLDEEAAGFKRNKAGGHGRRRETRRSDIRYGLR